MPARRIVLIAIAAVALLCAGCGITTAKNSRADDQTTAPTKTAVKKSTKKDTSALVTSSRALADRSPDVLVIDGTNLSSLSSNAYTDYREQGGSESVTLKNDDPSTAFGALCSGQVDIVASSDPINKAESKVCRSAGIQPVQIQVASDAVVLATENETDVGADCLTMAQVQATFRAGSPVTTWSQLGFDDVKLKVAGPAPGSSAFSFFGQYLVNSGQTTLEDFRYNYHAKSTEDKIRDFVVGTEKQGELATEDEPVQLAKVATANAYIVGQQDTLVGARKYIRQSKEFHKAADLLIAQHKYNTAERLLKKYRSQLAAADAVLAHDRLIEKQSKATLGHLGVFYYDYYTLYEEQLRPLEISNSSKPEDCVFPSQATITAGTYPLARRLLLTFSLQELRRDEALRGFLLSYLNNASKLATTLNMVPLPSNILVQEQRWLEGKDVTSTTTTTSVSTTSTTSTTSTQPSEETSMSGTGSSTADQQIQKSTTSTTDTTAPTVAQGGSVGSQSSQIPTGVH